MNFAWLNLIGLVLVEGPSRVMAIEVWAMNPPYTRLKTFAEPLDCGNDSTNILCKNYLDKIFEGEEFADLKIKSYKPHYNEQFQAFVADIVEYVPTLFPGLPNIQMMVVGSDYSRFIEESDTGRDLHESFKLPEPSKRSGLPRYYSPPGMRKNDSRADYLNLHLSLLRKNQQGAPGEQGFNSNLTLDSPLSIQPPSGYSGPAFLLSRQKSR